MTPGEIISASIAGVALLVAWLARQDSRKLAKEAQRANELVAHQLELVEKEQSRQVQKEMMENRPHFFWHSGSGGGVYQSYEFINQGAIVSKATVTNDAGVQSEIWPKDVIAPNQHGTVTFRWQNQARPKTVNFIVEFNDKLNARQKINYSISSHPSGDWKFPPELM